MRHRDHGAGIAHEELLQPVDRFGVEMVGRFVEQQHVGVGQQELAQRDATFLAARQIADDGVPRRQPQRVRGDFHLRVEVSAGGGEDGFALGLFLGELIEVGVGLGVGGVDFIQPGFRLDDFAETRFDRLAHGVRRVELRLLRQVADADARHRNRLAFDIAVDTGHDADQRGLARTVQAQETDFRAGKKGQRDVLQDLPLGRHDLADPVEGINVLRHGCESNDETKRGNRKPTPGQPGMDRTRSRWRRSG